MVLRNRLSGKMLAALLVSLGVSSLAFLAAQSGQFTAFDFDVCEDTDLIGDAYIGHDHPNTTCGHYVSFGYLPPATVETALQRVATGASGALDVAWTGVSGDNRMFIVGQSGRIFLSNMDDVSVTNSLFLDIRTVVRSGGERGLLGLTFDPNYEQNGYFYVNYTTNQARGTFNGQDINDGDTIISRFTRSASNPNLADPTSELIIMAYDQPATNHNGGGVKFGPDDMLYISSGDGGGGGDSWTTNCAYGNGQCLNTYLGKILRIDVRNSSTSERYRVPSDNPFVGQANAKPEIWHYGLRNPWRFSFDRATEDMFIADVGQNAWEEISIAPDGSKGLNFGWRCYEGNHTFNTSNNSNCLNMSAFTKPIHEYAHSDGACSVTGGYVYRGTTSPEFQGTYIFSDYCSGDTWYLNKMADGSWARTQTVDTGIGSNQITSFGEDPAGELYMVLGTGNVYRIVISH